MNLNVRRYLSWAMLAVCIGLLVAHTFLLLRNRSGAAGGEIEEGVFDWLLLIFPLFGTLIATYRPENRLSWLFSLAGLAWVTEGFTLQFANFALITEPDSLPGGAFAAWLNNWLWVLEIGLLGTYALLLFPTGQLPGERWRPVAWLAGVGMLLAAFGAAFHPGAFENFDPDVVQNPYGLHGAETAFAIITSIGVISIGLAAVASACSLLLRLRRASGVERQQLKWFAYAAGILAVALVVTISAYAVSTETGQKASFSLVAVLGLPIAAGIAILRYHLYDIDVLINRTLVYGLLTATLAGLYAASLQLFKLLFETVSGQGSDATIVLTTLVLAAVFTPIKNRLQKLVDRYFGQVHDPTKEMQSYAEQLRSVVQVFNAVETSRQFLDHAVHATTAECGVVYLAEDGDLRPLAQLGDEIGRHVVRIPIRCAGQGIGFLALGRRLDGSDYGTSEMSVLQSTADLVGEAIVLALRGPTRD